jgi:hypothetical protein
MMHFAGDEGSGSRPANGARDKPFLMSGSAAADGLLKALHDALQHDI